MTHRERFLAVLERRVPDRIPFVARLDLWYAARRHAGTLPSEVADLSIAEIEARLHMGRSARFSGFAREVREGVRESLAEEGDRLIRTLELEGRTLREVRHRTAAQRAGGMGAHLAEPFLKTAEDYRAMIAVWERTRWAADPAALDRFDKEVGHDGLPLLILGAMPFHRIMLNYAGYDRFYYHLADFPDLVGELCAVMEARYEALWPELARSSARMILHGTHWSSAMTPPPLFEKHLLPYARRFSDAMHAAGKQCVLHADADLSALLDHVVRAGVDVADCFACAPLVPLRLAEARRAWGDRVVIWGGFPSTLLEPTASEDEFRRHLDAFCEEIADGRAVIVGVSDNVLPGALWPRLKALAERAAALRPADR